MRERRSDMMTRVGFGKTNSNNDKIVLPVMEKSDREGKKERTL